jgi:ketosteroid isomerase-like protein
MTANAEVAKGAYEAFARGDIEAVLASFAEDVEWYEAEGVPWGGLHHGRDEVARNVFGVLIETFDDYGATPERYIESGDTVVVLGRYSGVGRKSGKTLDAAFAHVWNLEGGRLKVFNHYADTARIVEAVAS